MTGRPSSFTQEIADAICEHRAKMSSMIDSASEAVLRAIRPGDDPSWGEVSHDARLEVRAIVLAVLKAMREPTEAMAAAASKAGDVALTNAENDRAIWEAMIDAAMAETTSSRELG